MSTHFTLPVQGNFYTEKDNQKPTERVRISRLQNGIGWEVETYSLERALELWKKLENEFKDTGGWEQKRK